MPAGSRAGKYLAPSRTQIMQCHEGLEEDARVVGPLVDRRRLALQAEERVDGGLGRADRVFDGEDDILRLLAELTHEGQVLRALGHDLRPVTRLAPEELAGDERHH